MENEKLFQHEGFNSHLWYSQRTRFAHPEWTPIPKCASAGADSPPSHLSAAVGMILDNFVFPVRKEDTQILWSNGRKLYTKLTILRS